MFLPVGDSPNPPGRAWVTGALIAVNVAVYLLLLPLSYQAADPADPAFLHYLQAIAGERGLGRMEVRVLARQVSAYDLVVFRHGFRPASASAADLLTSMFLHGGLLHLLGNMLFLWIYGDNVEHRLGRLGFLLAYLGTGVAATVGDGLLRMGSEIPSVGASGAISGVLGLYFLWFPRNRVRVWVFLFPLFANVVELPARFVLGMYLVVQNILPVLLTAGQGGVSHGAHIGGFVGGVALAFVLDRWGMARPEQDLRRPPAAPGQPVERFRQALAEGRWQDAAEWYFRTPHSRTRGEVRPAEKGVLGLLLEKHGHPRAALAAYQRCLADHPHGPGRAAAHLGAARVLLGALGSPTAAYQHLVAVLEEDPSPDEAGEARALLDQVAARVRSMPLGPRR